MNNYPILKNQNKRLDQLNLYTILDTHTEAIFDDLTKMVSKLLNIPIVLISLIDKDGQWFKSKFGIDENETPSEISFCQYEIMQDEIFEVENTLFEKQFQQNRLVTSNAKIAFYAFTPLTYNEELNTGKLYTIDRGTRKLSEFERSILKTVSKTIMRLIEFRKNQEEQIIYHTPQTISSTTYLKGFTKTSYPKNLFLATSTS